MTVYSVSQGGVVNAADVTQFFNLLTGAMTDQPVTVANRIRAALSGATGGGSGGWVGNSPAAFGPPTSGTFLGGDWCLDGAGALWRCNSSGSPGTWLQASPYYQRVTLSGSAASVTVTFPQSLRVVDMEWHARVDTGVYQNVFFQLNSATNTGGTYVGHHYQVQGTTTPTMTQDNSGTTGPGAFCGIAPGPSADSGVFAGAGHIKIQGLGQASTYPNMQFQGGGWPSLSQAVMIHGTFMCGVASPYTQVGIVPTTGNFVAGSEVVITGWT